jgi:hypothetical protein
MNKRQEFWLLHYAARAFRHTAEACRSLSESGMTSESPAYYPLMAGAYTLYGRPFLKNRGIGKLPLEFVPDERRADHLHLATLRDTFYAHSDATTPPDATGPKNDVLVYVQRGLIRCGLRELRTLAAGLPLLRGMADVLAEKAHREIRPLDDEIGLRAPMPDGVYRLNVEDEPAPLLLPLDPDDE